jgi:uncharacterized protein (DUF2141 family)
MKTLLFLAICLTTIICNAQETEQAYELKIQIEGLQTNEGNILLEIVTPDEKPFKNIKTEVTNSTCQLVQQLPKGTYMVSYYHDANNNNKMDKMFMGIPKEGYGFSNNPDSKYGPPAIDNMLFTVASDTLIVINNVQW